MAQSVDGISIADSRGNYITVNPSFCKMFDYNETELLGMNVKDLVSKESGIVLFPKVVAGESGFRQAKMVKKDGSHFWVEIAASPIKIRDRIFVLGNFRDITKRKQAENALQRSETKFRNLVEASSDLIWEVNRDGEYLYASPQIEEILGYKPAEVIGKTPFTLMPSEESERVCEIFKDMKDKGKTFVSFENINIHRNGSPVVLETSGVPFFDESGEVIGYRGIDRDITERKKTEDALVMEKEKLEDATTQIKKLSGLLPICASCKKIRDDQGYWNKIESYIEKNSDAYFSHGLCPECSDKLYGKEDWYIKRKKKRLQ